MTHAKFQGHGTSAFEVDFQRFGHIKAWQPSCHMICTIYILIPLPKEHIKFGYDWPSGFREGV